MTTTTMTDLIHSTGLTADDEVTFTGWYRRDRRWNGFLCVLLDDEETERFVTDYNDAMREAPQDSMWEFEGDQIIEVAGYADGERFPVAQRITVDGVTLWDFTDSGIAWGTMDDEVA